MLVNKEQEMRTSCIIRIPSEMLKLKGNKPGQIVSGRNSHKGAQNPSAAGLPPRCMCPFLISSVQDPYTSDLCFQSLTTSLPLYWQCFCVRFLILIERTMNSKIKIKIDITTCSPKCKLNSVSPEAYSKASLILLVSINLLQFCTVYLDFVFSVVWNMLS